jgi:hypothetical protein
MEAELKNKTLFIELDIHDPTPSSTGKTLVVAGTRGRWQTSVTIDGQSVWINANAYVYPQKKVAGEEKKEEPKGKARAAAKQARGKVKPVVEDDDDKEEYDGDGDVS